MSTTLAILLLTGALAIDLTPGIYTLSDDDTGTKVTTTDGNEVRLRKLVSERLGRGSMRSESNANDFFYLQLDRVGPFPAADREGGRLAVIVGGVCMVVVSEGDRGADGRVDLGMYVRGADAADAVAKALDIVPHRRAHPGHRLLVAFAPEKKVYAPGEPVTLVMTIKNVGEVTVGFADGGMNRGPRNNQFSFLCYRNTGFGKAVPDTGDPTNFGGLASFQRLAPGETFTKSVDLSKWFELTEPDNYRITGMFRLSYSSPKEAFGPEIWSDFAIGECDVRVEKKEP